MNDFQAVLLFLIAFFTVIFVFSIVGILKCLCLGQKVVFMPNGNCFCINDSLGVMP